MDTYSHIDFRTLEYKPLKAASLPVPAAPANRTITLSLKGEKGSLAVALERCRQMSKGFVAATMDVLAYNVEGIERLTMPPSRIPALPPLVPVTRLVGTVPYFTPER